MKNQFLVTIASGLICCAATFSTAQAQNAPVPNQMPMHHQFHKVDMVEMTKTHLNNLKSKLVLTDAQQSSWNTWANFQLAEAKVHQEKWQEMMKERKEMNRPDFKNLTSTELLDLKLQHTQKAIERLQARQTALNQEKDALAPLYQSLSPLQKTVFDLYAKKNFHGHGHHSQHQWPGRFE